PATKTSISLVSSARTADARPTVGLHRRAIERSVCAQRHGHLRRDTNRTTHWHPSPGRASVAKSTDGKFVLVSREKWPAHGGNADRSRCSFAGAVARGRPCPPWL